MKDFLFLAFVCMSFFSIGQETQSTQNPQPVKVEKLNNSKESKITKRVRIIRVKEEETPKVVQEPIKKD
jgi:hypothetical protein